MDTIERTISPAIPRDNTVGKKTGRFVFNALKISIPRAVSAKIWIMVPAHNWTDPLARGAKTKRQPTTINREIL